MGCSVFLAFVVQDDIKNNPDAIIERVDFNIGVFTGKA
jgi:hypothetical protein